MNNPITVKIESNIDITDEQKNELREKLVYAFIEQLRKSGMYKVTEEKDGYAWILRADLILPKKHEAEPVTWYTADENQPDSVGDDVLIVDHDGKYHVAYYCSKGNWIDTNTGNPIDVIKWRYLDGDSNEKRH